MRRKVAAGIVFAGWASVAVVGTLVGRVGRAEPHAPGSLAASGSNAAQLELNAPTEPAKAAPRPEAPSAGVPALPVRQKPAAGKKATTPVQDPNVATKKTPAPAKDQDAAKKGPAAERPAEADDDAKMDSPSAGPAKEKPPTEPGKEKSPAGKSAAPKAVLTPQMAALRDRIRAVLAQHFRQPLNTNDNSPAQLLDFCLAFGCDTEIRYGNSAGNAMSGIGCLCYNYPCAGYRLLGVEDGKAMARVGYALQETPGEMLAVLAQSTVPDNYEIRVGERRGRVSDLVEAEKLSCLPGIDLSQKLIGLSYYLPDGAAWKNARGDGWSLERIVREELRRSPASDGPDATDHLMGLAYALERHGRDGRTIQGQYERAQKFLGEYQDFAFKVQNADGSWNPRFFAAKGPGRDLVGVLQASGRILEWLVASLPADRLQDRRVTVSVAYVTALAEGSYEQANLAYASTREIGALMHALHALKLYDRRVFQPAEPEKPAKADVPASEAAATRNAVR